MGTNPVLFGTNPVIFGINTVIFKTNPVKFGTKRSKRYLKVQDVPKGPRYSKGT